MSEKPFDFGLDSVANFWTQAGKAMLDAQQNFAQAVAGGANTTPSAPSWGFPFAAPASAGAPFGGFSPAGFPFGAFSAGTFPMGTFPPGAFPPGGSPAAVPGAEGLQKATSAIAELWTKAAQASATLAKSFGQQAGAAPVDPTIAATFRSMADPRSWLANLGGLETYIGRTLEGPQLADLGQAQRQQARIMQAWMQARQRSMEHAGVVLDAWLRATKAFSDEVARTTSESGKPEPKALLTLWTSTANRVLLETQHSEAFLTSQAAMIRAMTELQLAQQEVAERWSAQYGMPTRTEVDDLTRTVTELRREIRSLRRAARKSAGRADGETP